MTKIFNLTDIILCASIFVLIVVQSGCNQPPTDAHGGIENVYVDASSGNDSLHDGTSPYRTISKALDYSISRFILSNEDVTVNVAPGIYDSALGERFPIYLRSGIHLVALNNNRSGLRPTFIDGAGNFTSHSLSSNFLANIITSYGSTINGFYITAKGGVGVVSEDSIGSPAQITNNTITNCDYGIIISGTSRSYIYGNTISKNKVSGIETFGKASPNVIQNFVDSNSIGVTIHDHSVPNLGSDNYPGNNAISGNVNCGVYNKTDSTILAIGNYWDVEINSITSSNICDSGADIANFGIGVVKYNFTPDTTNSIFQDALSINLQSPGNSSIVIGVSPHLKWISTNSNLVVAAIFARPIKIYSSSIGNKEDIVWAWHSGLVKGSEGDIEFSDGVTPIDGNIYDTLSPIPLKRGKTYYWAVWAWDKDGIVILKSSKQYTFTIAN